MSGSNCITSLLCICTTIGYIRYCAQRIVTNEWDDTIWLHNNTLPFVITFTLQTVLVSEYIRRSHLNQVRKVLQLSGECEDLKAILRSLSAGLVVVKKKCSRE